MFPQTTRLRWVAAKDKKKIQAFCDTLGARIEIKNIVHANGEWVLWFVPSDTGSDISSMQLKETPSKGK